MTSSTIFINNLIAITGTSINRMNKMGTMLRRAGLVQKGGRGHSAASLSSKDAANILIGFLGAEKPEGAAEIVDLYRPMEIVGGDLSKTDINTKPRPKSFGEVVEMLLNDSLFSLNLDSVRVSRHYPKSVITYVDEKKRAVHIEFGYQNEMPDKFKHFQVEVIIDGQAIRKLLGCLDGTRVAYTMPGQFFKP